MSRLDEFIDLICSQVDKGIYVWGGNGQDLLTVSNPKAWITSHETSDSHTKDENIRRDMALFQTRKAEGVNPIRAFDCSGLMYWAGKAVGVFHKDVAARHIYAMCDKVTDIQRGDFVFKGNGDSITHVGCYIGNGIVVEAKGRDYGVVETKHKPSAWVAVGRLPALQEDAEDDAPEVPETTLPFVRVKGGYNRTVRVRTGNGKKFSKIATAHGGDEFPYIGRAESDPHWYNIEYNGRTDAWITDGVSYTEVIYHG